MDQSSEAQLGKCQKIANDCLAHLRRGTREYRYYVEVLEKALRLMNINPEDFEGATKEDIKKYHSFGYLINIQSHLNTLRLGATLPDFELKLMRANLEAAGLTILDIPTTEEELARLSQAPPCLMCHGDGQSSGKNTKRCLLTSNTFFFLEQRLVGTVFWLYSQLLDQKCKRLPAI